MILSLVFNLEWTVPAWILLALHFIKGWSLWWFFGAMGLWILFVLIRLLVFSSLANAGDYKDPPKENKNPYSASNKYKKTDEE